MSFYDLTFGTWTYKINIIISVLYVSDIIYFNVEKINDGQQA